MNYTLMHKEQSVMDVELDEATGVITLVGQLQNAAHLPIGISVQRGTVNRAELNRWWAGRAIPASRSGIRDALEILQVPMAQLLLEKCLGLSLSDQYWLRPQAAPVCWADINFFENPFSEDVGNALFGTPPVCAGIDLMSPDNTSDGWLKKKWSIVDGKRCLVKGGSGPFQQEPLNEALASAVLRRLGNVPYVPYSLMWENDLPYSICPDFITPETELISAAYIMQTQKKGNHVSGYQHFLNCCEVLGIPNVVDSLNKMLTLDYLIVNSDRHFGNFGAVRNADTLEWLGLSPIFDCGTSMWHDQLTNRIRAVSLDIPSKPFKPTHSDQLGLVTSFDWLDLSTLTGIEEEYHSLLMPSPYLDDQRRAVLSHALTARIENLHSIVQTFTPSGLTMTMTMQ